jgi:hypothetical protein
MRVTALSRSSITKSPLSYPLSAPNVPGRGRSACVRSAPARPRARHGPKRGSSPRRSQAVAALEVHFGMARDCDVSISRLTNPARSDRNRRNWPIRDERVVHETQPSLLTRPFAVEMASGVGGRGMRLSLRTDRLNACSSMAQISRSGGITPRPIGEYSSQNSANNDLSAALALAILRLTCSG